MNNIKILKEDVENYQCLLSDILIIQDKDVQFEQFKYELNYLKYPSLLNKAILGIMYFKMALNHNLNDQKIKNLYSYKSLFVLNEVLNTNDLPEGLRPFISAYHAASLFLIGKEERKFSAIYDSLRLLHISAKRYQDICYVPIFIRLYILKDLPWYFLKEKRAVYKYYKQIICFFENNEVEKSITNYVFKQLKLPNENKANNL